MQAHTGSRNLIGSVYLTGANGFCTPKIGLITHVMQAFGQVALIVSNTDRPSIEPMIGRIAPKVPIIVLNPCSTGKLDPLPLIRTLTASGDN